MKDFLWRHKTLLAIWLIVFGIGGYAGYVLFFKYSGGENPYVLSSNSNQPATQDTSKPAQEQLKKVGLNQSAQDGGFEFTVSGVSCEERTIGINQYAMAEAEGQFCRVSVKAKNVSSATAGLPLKAQVLYTPFEDVALPPDIPATQYAQEDQTKGYWYEDIASGESSIGDLIYDISGNRASRVILHGADGTPGIEVSLE